MMNENTSFIQATRIGGHAYRYLTARPRKGRVISSFSGGINLLFKRGEAFVPVQSTNVPLHPWAIEIAGDAIHLAEETRATTEDGKIRIEEVEIWLSDARIEELSLPRFSTEEISVAQRNFPILSQFMEEARKTHPPDPFQEQIDAILQRWHESKDPAILLELIGLGAGSTPSGDDVLVGLIAGMSVFERVDYQVKEALPLLRSGIQKTARARTSLSSSQMLLSACDCSFPDPILALLESLAFQSNAYDLMETITHVSQLGHHSGIAILSGLTWVHVS